ncbi:hypothetical protein AVEN_218858-1 [Araneus ventricosus]|uniref:Uncharacterized protein n=1 Tax=Araneus ventricosus TaxID=182803 RepID=A0A4Y2V284_ARAVE|nr:hypothetical protein AVEN_218858-1 [Araneus ventricosus]
MVENYTLLARIHPSVREEYTLPAKQDIYPEEKTLLQEQDICQGRSLFCKTGDVAQEYTLAKQDVVPGKDPLARDRMFVEEYSCCKAGCVEGSAHLLQGRMRRCTAEQVVRRYTLPCKAGSCLVLSERSAKDRM